MRYIRRFALALGLLVLLPASAFARVAFIGTTARLTEPSDQALQSAVRDAVEMALRGAKAMGLPHVTLRDVSLLDKETVVIEILASDTELASEGRPDSDASAAGIQRPARLDL